MLSGITMIASLSYQKIIDSFILGNEIPIIQYRGANSVVRIVVDQINIVISNFHLFFIALVVIFTLQMILSIIKGIFIAKISNRVNKELINNYLNSVVKLPIRYFKDWETGEILSRFSDMEEIINLISEGGVAIVINIFMVIAGGAILININLSMFLMVMGILFLYAVIVLIFKHSIASIKLNIFEKNSQLVSKLKETIDNICTIKNCSAENKFVYKIREMSENTLQYIYKGEIISESQIALLNNVERIGTIFILWLGSYLVIHNRISLGNLIAFESLLVFFFLHFNN